ncbi:uncharacterized protein LOC133194888 [Saccostrea echinata]|uniref:uncharacterized protein LOC133194888 n=1 Tax=Saccostrea echinata TaxID=191078 RepID=UPI002A80418B|nr:uncharacterized protein LOC133194888 [Saccostrea echinata]
MIQTIKQNKEILKSNKVDEVTNYKSILMEYRKICADNDLSVLVLQTNTEKGRELSIELGEYKATMTQTSLSNLTEDVTYLSMRDLLKKARVIATIPTGVKPLFRVACVGSDKAWVSGEDTTIRCVNIHGSVQENVRCVISPDDISVIREGYLIYSDDKIGTVNIVRHGRSDVLITTREGWKPSGLCCTRSGDILVNVNNGKQNKIVQYQGQGMKQPEKIFKDENGKPIYASGQWILYFAENNNGDMCVFDMNANAVVVVDKTEELRFRHYGFPAMKKWSFNPRQIETGSMNQIIVADYSNDCLHILDQDGQFLRYVGDI